MQELRARYVLTFECLDVSRDQGVLKRIATHSHQLIGAISISLSFQLCADIASVRTKDRKCGRGIEGGSPSVAIKY
jgi:hypothetical protein